MKFPDGSPRDLITDVNVLHILSGSVVCFLTCYSISSSLISEADIQPPTDSQAPVNSINWSIEFRFLGDNSNNFIFRSHYSRSKDPTYSSAHPSSDIFSMRQIHSTSGTQHIHGYSVSPPTELMTRTGDSHVETSCGLQVIGGYMAA